MFSIFEKYSNLFLSFSHSSDGSMKLTNNPDLEEIIFRNRKNYFIKNNIEPRKVISAEIVHRNKIAIVDSNDNEKIITGADGLLSQNKDMFLSITSADCLPIFLFDPEEEIIGIIHAGWRSLASLKSARQEKNILANAIEKFKTIGGKPENILAGIGPAICQKHYEIGPGVAEKFAKYPGVIKRDSKNLFLDIKKIAKMQLLALGISNKNMEISPECTFEFPEKYFSARRDKPREVEAMMAIIGMKG
jgi:polyphenol oxidase